jgi:aminoglycoside phosphotransferase family enzyme/predicted kinase
MAEPSRRISLRTMLDLATLDSMTGAAAPVISTEIATESPQISPRELLDAMESPATYGCSGPVEVRETHASWVFLAGRWAYKVKKPVRLGFLDYTTLSLRRAACHEEVRINQELAGDIYEGVVAIVPRGGKLHLAPAHTRGAVEYAVQMQRFDHAQTLQVALEANKVRDADLPAVAARLASFHTVAPVIDGGGAEATLRRWNSNLDEIEALVDPDTSPLDRERRFGEAFIAAHAREVDRRANDGRVRDAHGDLRCEHVLLTDPVRIVDRIEFDPALRQIDVGADLAFLLMDLEANGQPRIARELLSEYRRTGGDPGSDALVWFYAAYWALVRTKVALIARAEGTEISGRVDSEPARRRDLAERLCWRARGPLALILSGAPASGKSTLAAELSAHTDLPVISSDLVRKQLAGVAPTERGRPELYEDDFTFRTYRAMGDTARELLEDQPGVIIDATCGSWPHRDQLIRALAGYARLLFVECRVTLTTAVARATARMGQVGAVSDATPHIVVHRFREFRPLGKPPGASVAPVDCELPMAQQIDAVAAAADELMVTPPAS